MNSDSQQQRWRRHFAEGIVIVISILLAFAIDAAWDTVKQRQAESAVLQSLKGDLISSREIIVQTSTSNGEVLDSFDTFLNSSAVDLGAVRPDSAVRIMFGLYFFATFSPVQNAFRTSDLSTIRNKELRQGLASWSGQVEDVLEDEPLLHSAREQMESLSDVKTLELFANILRNRPFDSGEFPSIIAGMSADPEITKAILRKELLIRINLNKLDRLLTTTDTLLESLETY